ncbi:Protein kinase domain [Carpediemonas membranifera]|uniref:Protein kinase domain n=1 Tax=Carpediemonas membranifera TaxID=201153 RepID=A0A8J6B948_9EUKA|nr:Protein kinase domain [Carpediemonas membranifera]|eukprot:KAG9392562.1 Protein kinase domain [Carpediemonas membranifera]
MIGSYRLERTLGRGSFAKVKQAIHAKTNERVAIKIISTKDASTSSLTHIRTEVACLRMLDHPNVVNLREVLASSSHIYLVMELVTGGELLDRLALERHFPVGVARRYMIQLLSAVDHCHKKGIVHRDLKPENILLDEHGNAKISDFGLSALYVQGFRATMLATCCGSPHYVAPEVVSRGKYDGRLADMWSLGVLLYVMLTGCVPFSGKDMKGLFSRIKAGRFAIPAEVPADAASLIRRLLVVDPTRRATMAEVAQHPFVQGKLAVVHPVVPLVPLVETGSECARVVVTDHVMDAVLTLLGPEQEGSGLPSMNAFDLLSLSALFELAPPDSLFDTRRLLMIVPGAVSDAMDRTEAHCRDLFSGAFTVVRLGHLGKLKCTVQVGLVTVRFLIQFYDTTPDFTAALFVKRQGPRIEFLRCALDAIAASSGRQSLLGDSSADVFSSDSSICVRRADESTSVSTLGRL